MGRLWLIAPSSAGVRPARRTAGGDLRCVEAPGSDRYTITLESGKWALVGNPSDRFTAL